jgi:uncharacterized protein
LIVRRLAAVILALLPGAALAQTCAGQDLIAALPEAKRAAISAAADAAPYPQGNLWRATKDGQTVTLLGTYHLDDPRHAAIMDRVAPDLDGATVLLVEAGPAEEKELLSHMAKDPSLMLAPQDQPTLVEVLPDAEWQALAQAMRDRGVPPFMASRFRHWYVSMLLSVPPCAMSQTMASGGLDKRLIERAGARGIAVRALEPWDTALRIFDDMPQDAQISMIRSTLALEEQAEDHMATLTAAYFAEDSRLIWEFLRDVSYGLPGMTREAVDAEFAAMEEALMSARNRAWVPVIEGAAAQGPVFAAFGALHLSGQDGILALLERDGWSLERLPFPQ